MAARAVAARRPLRRLLADPPERRLGFHGGDGLGVPNLGGGPDQPAEAMGDVLKEG